MKKSVIKVFSLILSVILICLTFASCSGNSNDEETTTGPSENTAVDNQEVISDNVQNDTVFQPSTEETTTQPEITTQAPETTTQAPETTQTPATEVQNFSSTDITEVLSLYKQVATKNPTINGQEVLSIGDISGEGATTSLIKIVKPMLDDRVSTPYEHPEFPGKPSVLTEADITSASAVSDGTYTIITLQIKDQSGAENTSDNNEGSVGRATGIISGLQSKVGGVIEFKEGGSLTLTYTNCSITVKYNNETMTLVSGEWKNTGSIDITNASVYGILNVKKANAPLHTVITLK